MENIESNFSAIEKHLPRMDLELLPYLLKQILFNLSRRNATYGNMLKPAA